MTRPALPLAILAFAALPVAADLGVPAAPVQPIDPDGYRPIDADLAALGQLLFYDPILSGNANISCGT
ncbi:MAG: cytochrome c peroxidase, partial [Pseudomonadota bacterium]